MDKFGRVVIPKKVREALNLHAGSKLRANLKNRTLTLEAEARPYEIRYDEHGWPTIHFSQSVPLPADFDPVRDIREDRAAELLKW
ncbi:AbrB/MazE/SpoVT family DNA-binding domain-containing protein [Deinococcus aetherius]|nr:AbrB/MazE/SpoVT family DNA-binding domain-containing protein [Deinococcus aetherius]